jgi:UDP-N-acetylglucosamine:LPS N-acetylglucosamine transferase
MKVLIAAGGTGGHIYPGIAVAKEILNRDANREFCSSERVAVWKRKSFGKRI